MKEHKTVCCGDPCTCEKADPLEPHGPKREQVATGTRINDPDSFQAPKHTVEVPSGDVAEAFQLAINRAIHDAWQEGYQQGLRDSFPPPDAEDKEAEALERRLKDDPLHKLYLASREAGIQHDGDNPAVRQPTWEQRGTYSAPHDRTCTGHHLVADHNGEPVCCCGWNPMYHVRPPKTQGQAASAVSAHVKHHDRALPTDCPLYCTKHNHEEMGG